MSNTPPRADTVLDLRDAVDTLTKPREVKVFDHGRLLGTRTDEPLLTQLRRARTANIGPGNGGRARHERVTLNINASQLHTEIEKRVRQWALAAGVPRHWATNGTLTDWTDPAALLTAWHLRTLADPHFDHRPHTATLTSWIDQIRDLLDPPHRYPLNAPCPTCGQTWTTTLVDGHPERSHTLNVVERDPAHLSTVTCRHCGATWHGIEGAETLADLLLTRPITIPTHTATA